MNQEEPKLSNQEERHGDFLSLQDALHKIKTTILTTLVPLLVAGIWTLLANHFQQKALVQEVSMLNHRLSSLTAQMERINEKVIVMWASG